MYLLMRKWLVETAGLLKAHCDFNPTADRDHFENLEQIGKTEKCNKNRLTLHVQQ